MLKRYFDKALVEAGCDEAGRGCLAGPVVAAAVILPKKFSHKTLNDSKQLTHVQRLEIREAILKSAIAYGVGYVDHSEIDRINILNASFLAMHRALDQITTAPELLLIDGNRFKRYKDVPHQCIVKGDAIYMSIAAASILAKTYRDDYMEKLDALHPQYGWRTNKGYPTKEHREGIRVFGTCPYHRLTFQLLPQAEQGELLFEEDKRFQNLGQK